MEIDRLEAVRLRSMEEFGFGPTAMRKIKKCPNCGSRASSENKFCRECGSGLPTKTLYDFYSSLHRVCSGCNTVVSPQKRYCPQCGKRLEQVEQSTQSGAFEYDGGG